MRKYSGAGYSRFQQYPIGGEGEAGQLSEIINLWCLRCCRFEKTESGLNVIQLFSGISAPYAWSGKPRKATSLFALQTPADVRASLTVIKC